MKKLYLVIIITTVFLISGCNNKEIEINSAMAVLKDKALSCEKVTLDGKVLTKSMLERLFYGYKIAEKLILD